MVRQFGILASLALFLASSAHAADEIHPRRTRDVGIALSIGGLGASIASAPAYLPLMVQYDCLLVDANGKAVRCGPRRGPQWAFALGMTSIGQLVGIAGAILWTRGSMHWAGVREEIHNLHLETDVDHDRVGLRLAMDW